MGDFRTFASSFSKVCGYRRPHVTGFVAFSKVSTLERVFKSLQLQCAFSPDTCGRNGCSQGSPNFVQSADHPDFSSGKPSKTTKVSCGRRKSAKTTKSKKRKRLAVFDVVQIIQAKKIHNRLELMALPSKWQGEGKIDLAEFVDNLGPKVCNQAI